MDNRRDVEIEGATQVVTPRSDDGSAFGTPRGDPEDLRYTALEEATHRERLGSTNATFASTLTAASNATTAALSSVHSSSRSSERNMANYFHRHQTVEVLPRNSAPQAAWRKERPNSELLRTFTSSDPLNSRLHQRLLEEECDSATPSMMNAASPSRPTPRAAAAAGMRRVPSINTGLTRNSSWRVYLRNLPRALRFRQNTRSTTRYIDPANAASLRMRLRAQREQAARDAHDDFSDDEASAPSNVITALGPPGPMRLERQRSNFEDVGRYRDQPPDMESGPSSIDNSSIATPRAQSLKGKAVSLNADGSQDGQNRPGRTSSMFSLESAQVAGEKKQYKLVRINPDHSSQSDVTATEDNVSLFASNEVKTSQYSWWSFVPVFLYLTFQKTANLYFLLIGIFQMIPDISPTNGVPLQFLPLSIVTIIDALFAAFEDYKRHIADDQANSAITRVFNRELREFEEVQWRDVAVGDFVKIMNHETIPADVLILSVVPAEGTRNGGNTGICYVETKNLDGETNLKLREAPRATRHMFDSEEDAGESLQGYLESELPNGDINRYSGTLYIEEDQSGVKADDVADAKVGIPVTLKNMLLRGSKLRNTKWAFGLVVHTGVDSKIMMSSGDEFPVKLSSIDEMTNKQVIIVVFILIAMSVVGAIGDYKWLGDLDIPASIEPGTVNKSFIGTFVYFFTTLASMVPITLYVSITMVKALQGYFMERDLDMYDEENDVRMMARNMQLNEQLGQISHVFSDKTGTLTCNKMEFRKCSIFGKSYGKGTTAIGLAARLRNDFKGKTVDDVDSEDSGDDEFIRCPAPNVNFKDQRLWNDMAAGDERAVKIRDFFTHLALCHGVLIERLDAQPDDMEMPPIVYSASSPDEQALVSGAKYFGFEFVDREPGSVSLKNPEGLVEQYEILEVFEFDSTRKRMTVVVQKRKTDEELMKMTEYDEEEVLILTKGADSVLLPRLAASAENEAIKESTLEQLESFAQDGLRTLVICSKIMPLREWEEFHLRYRKVCSDLREVEAKSKGEKNGIDVLQDEMERNLTLLGATAIEDRLQDGVPETMERLAKAGISIWVLTGDMEETAINIGYACRLLNNDMQRHVINSSTYHTKGSILRQLDKIFHWIHEGKRMSENTDEDAAEQSTQTNEGEHALVIDGASLNLVLEDPLYNLHLLRVALLCKVVVACRVSPQQKAQLVELVKLNVPESHTLSIGDGANDVPMIQSAHIGIGISGQEGMQAVNSSDYALGQFRFLSTLLLTHGRWNYSRVAGLVLYTFYKNIVYCVSMFWYCLKPTAYSGTMIYSAFIQQGYNLFFTALPIMAYAVFDRDLPKEKVLEYPVLYHSGVRQRSFFSYGMFWKWIALAVIDSVGVYYVTLMTAYNMMRYGEAVELTVLQSIGWTILCVVVNARFCLMVNTWDVLEVGALVVSMALLYGFQFAIDEITWTYPDYDTYSFPWMFNRWQFWLGQIFAIVVILSKNFLYEGYRRRFNPDYADLVKEEIFLVKDTDVEASSGDDLKNYSPPQCSYLRPELAEMLDYRDRRVQDRLPVRFAAPGRSHLYRGFAFDQPAYIVNWILSSGGSNGPTSSGLGPLRRKGINPDVRQQILNSDDPVIFENERYQPFSGYGSTYPGYLLPTDRSRWSDRSGRISAMSIPLAGLELNLNVPGCDEEGWVYENDFKFFSSTPPDRDASQNAAQTNDDEHGNEPSSARSRPGSKKSNKNQTKKTGGMRGFVRRREWVLSERYKALLRERDAQILLHRASSSVSSGMPAEVDVL